MKESIKWLRVEHAMAEQMGETRLPFALYVVPAIMQEFWCSKVLTFICARRGHRLIDESYGGPESGCVAMYCERCGQSWHHQLY